MDCMLTHELPVIMCSKFCGVHGCGTDQEVQNTVMVLSGQVNEYRILSSPSDLFEDL